MLMKRIILLTFIQLLTYHLFAQIYVLNTKGPTECCPFPRGGTYEYTTEGAKDTISIIWTAENGWILNSDGQWSRNYTTSPGTLAHKVIVRWDDVAAQGAAQLKISPKSTKYYAENS